MTTDPKKTPPTVKLIYALSTPPHRKMPSSSRADLVDPLLPRPSPPRRVGRMNDNSDLFVDTTVPSPDETLAEKTPFVHGTAKALARLLGGDRPLPKSTIHRWQAYARKNRFENKHHGSSIFQGTRQSVCKVNRSGFLAVRSFIRSHESVGPSPNTKETLWAIDDDGITRVRKTKLLMHEPVRALHNSLHT
jgi:hypothetical protein